MLGSVGSNPTRGTKTLEGSDGMVSHSNSDDASNVPSVLNRICAKGYA